MNCHNTVQKPIWAFHEDRVRFYSRVSMFVFVYVCDTLLDERRCPTKFKTDRIKRAHFSFGGKLLTDEKSAQIYLRSIFNPTHQFLCFCLFFLSVRMDWVGKCCGRKLGGVNLVN
jgi:hypothetical protein